VSKGALLITVTIIGWLAVIGAWNVIVRANKLAMPLWVWMDK